MNEIGPISQSTSTFLQRALLVSEESATTLFTLTFSRDCFSWVPKMQVGGGRIVIYRAERGLYHSVGQALRCVSVCVCQSVVQICKRPAGRILHQFCGEFVITLSGMRSFFEQVFHEKRKQELQNGNYRRVIVFT